MYVVSCRYEAVFVTSLRHTGFEQPRACNPRVDTYVCMPTYFVPGCEEAQKLIAAGMATVQRCPGLMPSVFVADAPICVVVS